MLRFLVVGSTGSGKSTIVRKLCEEYNMSQVISYTTRPKRDSEIDKADHIFITEDEVSKYENDIVAYTEINSHKYFTTLDQIIKHDFYIIDPNGIEYLKKNVYGIKFVVLFIYADKDIRKQRLLSRGDTEEDIINRINSEMSQFTEFELRMRWDYLIENNDTNLDKTVRNIKNIIDKEIKKSNDKNRPL